MALTTCPKCGEKVSTNAEKCVHCGEVLNTQVNIDTNLAVENTYNWYLKYSKIIMVVAIVLAVIIVLVSLILMIDSDMLSLYLLPISVVLIGWGILFAKEAEWKAYTLKSLHEINTKKK
jgi:hypothetical protein